jgi:ABC-type spermidine/putrescine transport system permease subunit II
MYPTFFLHCLGSILWLFFCLLYLPYCLLLPTSFWTKVILKAKSQYIKAMSYIEKKNTKMKGGIM